MRNARGFTLVELAVALTIIALLMASLYMGGSSLLNSAKTVSLLSQIKDLAAASRDFKNRYGYYPGDLPNAATFITADGGVSGACSYATAGNVGNGLVDTNTESSCAIEHLVKARLLTKVELAGGSYTIQTPVGSGAVSLWYLAASKENAIRVTELPCATALAIDSKQDSAAASPLLTGLVTGWDTAYGSLTTCTPGAANDPVPVLLIRY